LGGLIIELWEYCDSKSTVQSFNKWLRFLFQGTFMLFLNATGGFDIKLAKSLKEYTHLL